MNKVHPYRALEREYITSQISLRELCRRHGITRPLPRRRPGTAREAGQEKREAYRARESESFIKHHADSMAAREAEIRIHALDAIDEAITKFRSDMQRTEKRLIGGEWVEVPVMMITPQATWPCSSTSSRSSSHRPSVITEGRGVNVMSEALPIDALQAIIEATRGLAEPVPQESPIPRSPRRLDG